MKKLRSFQSRRGGPEKQAPVNPWPTRISSVMIAWGLAAVGQTQAAAVVLSDPLTSFDAANFTTSAADPIIYDASGAHFGTGVAGDGGRSYQRTIQNFAQALSFTAEITFETRTDDQGVFFGMGSGDAALWGTPDWSTQSSSASFWAESANDKFVRFRTANDINQFGDTGVAGFDPGIHRFRMTYDKALNQLIGAIDLNYAGGPFVADAVTGNFPINTASLNAADGWPFEPSRIFFGGDDGAIFRDFTVDAVVAGVPDSTPGILLLLGGLGIATRRWVRTELQSAPSSS